MIKRLTFVRRADGVPLGEFAERWRADALATGSPRPDRLVHCVVRPGRTDRPYHGVAVEWFADEASLTAHDEAERTPDRVVDATMLRNADSMRDWAASLERQLAAANASAAGPYFSIYSVRPGKSSTVPFMPPRQCAARIRTPSDVESQTQVAPAGASATSA